jgi:uncharacterized protein (UPF0264 family)
MRGQVFTAVEISIVIWDTTMKSGRSLLKFLKEHAVSNFRIDGENVLPR